MRRLGLEFEQMGVSMIVWLPGYARCSPSAQTCLVSLLARYSARTARAVEEAGGPDPFRQDRPLNRRFLFGLKFRVTARQGAACVSADRKLHIIAVPILHTFQLRVWR